MGGTHIGAIYSGYPQRSFNCPGHLLQTKQHAVGKQLILASPVPIVGGNIYMMATYASDGQFADDNNYFNASGSHPTGVTSGPLTALPDNAYFWCIMDFMMLSGPGCNFPATAPTGGFCFAKSLGGYKFQSR